MRRFFMTVCMCARVCRLCMGRREVISPGIHHISLRSWLSLLSHVALVPLSWDTESDISLPFSLFPLLKSTSVSFCLLSLSLPLAAFFFFDLLITRSHCAHTSGCLVFCRLLHRCNCTLRIWSTTQTCSHSCKRGVWGRNHTHCCPVLLKLQANLEHCSGSWPVDDILQRRTNAKSFMTLPVTLRNVLVCICCSSAI